MIETKAKVWYIWQCEWFRLSELCNVIDSDWCEHIVHLTIWVIQDNANLKISMIQANMKVKLSWQCQWFRLMWTSCSQNIVNDSSLFWMHSTLYNVCEAGWCECRVQFTMSVVSGSCESLVHFTMWVIQTDVNL